jgi:hypothetical protein
MSIEIVILPRQSMTWEEFLARTPERSIALDGVVRGGPAWDEKTLHVNFDHHEAVVREATMSTAMQVLFAIKGGLMDRMGSNCRVYVNDPDQDTSFACWLLLHHKQFSGVQSHPVIGRLLALNDRWDITGGAFPMSLDDGLVRQHCWVFEPYTNLRKFGHLASADEATMRICLEACFSRLSSALMGRAEEKDLDTRYELLYSSPRFKIVNEIGGNEARYHLFSQGLLDAYVSRVATRPDGRYVYTIGRRSRYINFPVKELYEVLSAAEPIVVDPLRPLEEFHRPRWGGSDLIGGSNREYGSGLSWEQIRDAIEGFYSAKKAA